MNFMNSVFSFLNIPSGLHFNLRTIFSSDYLLKAPSTSMDFGRLVLILLGLSIIIGIVYKIIPRFKDNLPRFERRFLSRVADLLIYPPIVLVLYVFIRFAGIAPFNQPVYFVAILAIWLIWFLVMLYYRLVVIRHLWLKYNHHKAKEKYIHGKRSS